VTGPPRNLPNWLTIARIVLAAVLFAILHTIGWAEAQEVAGKAVEGSFARSVLGSARLLLNTGLVIFVLAAISDILDGQIARYYGLTTDFGRIADPFADKVIISGAFLLLTTIAASGVSAWMVVVIVARESLVDGIRGFAEAKGIAFPASFWGKFKMVLQCICIGWILLALANARTVPAGPIEPWALVITQAMIAITIFITVFSGALYVLKARTVLRAGAMNEAGSAAKREPAASPSAGGR
jgi:CDP-diacylglycerol--glycerol-3-phosphate 3-phosphatidyltransferase